jgi:hypothetical protein
MQLLSRENFLPKPTTKNQILETAQNERAALEELIATLTIEQITQPNVIGEWAIKDVLSHLTEWEQMVIKWYEMGEKGLIPSVPSEEYNWAQLPQLNYTIYLKFRDKSLVDIQESFKASYKTVLKTIQAIPENVLFTRGHYAWTRNNTLSAYFISCTSSHYRWARKEIRKATRTMEKM